jgi:hypothetical protein
MSKPPRIEGKIVERLVRQVRVRNEHGDELTVFEFEEFRELRTARGPRRKAGRRRFMLNTGEPVDEVDKDHFVLASSGETLRSVVNFWPGFSRLVTVISAFHPLQTLMVLAA